LLIAKAKNDLLFEPTPIEMTLKKIKGNINS